MLSPIQTRLANIDHTVNGTFDNLNDILTKQSVSEMLLATPVVRPNWKKKVLLMSFCPFQWMLWRLQSSSDLRFVTVGHSSNLRSFSAYPQQFIPPFADGLKVSETCLRHILLLYLIYNLTASKYPSLYLNCQGQRVDNLQKKHLSHPEARHLTAHISLSSRVDNLQEASI